MEEGLSQFFKKKRGQGFGFRQCLWEPMTNTYNSEEHLLRLAMKYLGGYS